MSRNNNTWFRCLDGSGSVDRSYSSLGQH